MHSKVTVFGSNNMDITAYMERIPEKGETVTGKHFESGIGGKGANQAIQAARISKNRNDVTFISCLGGDAHSNVVRQFVSEKEGCAFLFFEQPQASAGTAYIWVDREGTNSIVVIPGANGLLNRDLLKTKECELVSCLQTSRTLIAQLETPLDGVQFLFELAKSSAVSSAPMCILNPAPMPENGLSKDILKNVDLIVLNQAELAILADIGPVACEDLSVEMAKSLTMKCLEIIEKDKDFKGHLIVTLGSDGCIVYDREASINTLTHVKGVQAPGKVVDTTGAGDAFTGAVATFLAEGLSLSVASQKACIVAAHTVVTKGTVSSYKTRAELPL